MNFISVALLALAMSTDAFAAAVGQGMALRRPHWREAARTGAIFGTIEATTPLVGWALGLMAVDTLKAWDHWIAFMLLGALGTHMVVASFKNDKPAGAYAKPTQHSFTRLAIIGFATSIDAMAVGIGLAFIDVNIVHVAAAVGFTTFVMATLGVMLGQILGAAARKRAELLGGILLLAIGATILYEHLSAT